MKLKTWVRGVLMAAVMVVGMVGVTEQVKAAGTVTGTVYSPHGETAAVDYVFSKSGSADVSGTTGADGVINQSLANGDWSLSVTPPSSFEYAETLTIDLIRIGDGDTFDLGPLYFYFEVPDGADDDLDEFMAMPPECSQSGTPVIVRAYYEDETKGSFLYEGRSANVIVVADAPGYTVEVDYSFIEGHQNPGVVTETAADQGNGKYRATHTITTSQEGGGMPMISVSDGGSTTTTCLQPGPVNLDIRQFLDGSDTTDFTSVADFRAIENFTMHKDGIVKVRFTRNVNMLDPTVQRFMKSIGNKMISNTGRLTLDADAVLDLKNAGAEITMYGINVNSPKILVDGSENSSVVSGVTYNKSAGTLVFAAAHFTTFEVVDGAASTLSAPTVPGCGDTVPVGAPHLFEIRPTQDTATLYFTPVNNTMDGYVVTYGHSAGDMRYGASFAAGPSSGVMSWEIGALQPGAIYHFAVRAGNGCAPGAWSNWLGVTAGGATAYDTASW